MPCSCAVCTTSAGGGPSAFTSSDTGCSSATSICASPVVSVQPSRWCGSTVLGQRRDVVLREHLLDEVAVLLRDHRLELALELGGVAVGAARLLEQGRRHHEVDAVRAAVHVLVDPVQLDLELRRA